MKHGSRVEKTDTGVRVVLGECWTRRESTSRTGLFGLTLSSSSSSSSSIQVNKRPRLWLISLPQARGPDGR